jgi:uncharacterized caspase-like protein
MVIYPSIANARAGRRRLRQETAGALRPAIGHDRLTLMHMPSSATPGRTGTPGLRAACVGAALAGLLAIAPGRAADSDAPAPSASEGEKRIALVIGNAAYESGPLRNPVNDARAMTATLGQLGFQVIALENASQGAMKQAIDEFGDSLQRAGKNTVGLFYYSGHGVQVKGRNYIVPVGARIRTERQVEYESVDVSRALAAMEDAGNTLNIVILDACRDNPFAQSTRNGAGGLAMMDAASGTLIAYATAPGRTADDGAGANGLYTAQLIRHMRTPGLKVEEVFKRVRVDVERLSNDEQVPWESSSLKGDFYFAGRLAALSPSAGGALDEEEVLWKAIEDSSTSQDFDDYLARYPQGRFAAAARIKARQARDRIPPLSPDLAALSFRSTPPGATVYLDGGYAGRTPLDVIGIQPRRYAVEMQLEGHLIWEDEVVLRSGQHLAFNEQLKPHFLAMLDTRSIDPGIEIYVDGFFRGKGGTVISDIQPGERVVEARRARSRRWSQTVAFQPGRIEQLVLAVPSPYRVGVFPGRFTGQYVHYVNSKYGSRTSAEWALAGLNDALTQEPGVKLTYSFYDGFAVQKQALAELQKQSWKGLITSDVNTAFLRRKARDMDLDAVVLLAYSDPGDAGPIDVYVYDPERDQLHKAHGSWRTGNLSTQVTKVARGALEQFLKARDAQ